MNRQIRVPSPRERGWGEVKKTKMKKVKIYSYQVALVYKNGEYKKMLQPGNY